MAFDAFGHSFFNLPSTLEPRRHAVSPLGRPSSSAQRQHEFHANAFHEIHRTVFLHHASHRPLDQLFRLHDRLFHVAQFQIFEHDGDDEIEHDVVDEDEKRDVERYRRLGDLYVVKHQLRPSLARAHGEERQHRLREGVEMQTRRRLQSVVSIREELHAEHRVHGQDGDIEEKQR